MGDVFYHSPSLIPNSKKKKFRPKICVDLWGYFSRCWHEWYGVISWTITARTGWCQHVYKLSYKMEDTTNRIAKPSMFSIHCTKCGNKQLINYRSGWCNDGWNLYGLVLCNVVYSDGNNFQLQLKYSNEPLYPIVTKMSTMIESKCCFILARLSEPHVISTKRKLPVHMYVYVYVTMCVVIICSY